MRHSTIDFFITLPQSIFTINLEGKSININGLEKWTCFYTLDVTSIYLSKAFPTIELNFMLPFGNGTVFFFLGKYDDFTVNFEHRY